MSNPFDALGTPKAVQEAFDEWSGQFSCQEKDCHGWANIARYDKTARQLTWQCQDGHESKAENIDE